MKSDFKNCLFLLVLFVVGLSAKADNIGKDSIGLTIDGTVVMAESQSFTHRIDGLFVNPELDYMLLKFRDTTKSGKRLKSKGEIGAFSLKDSKLLWTIPLDYNVSTVCCLKSGVIVSNGKDVSMLNSATGAVRWQGKFVPVQYDDSTNVVLGYPSDGSSKLSGYDLNTGDKLWTVSLSHSKNWGWDRVIREDSVHWLIVADELNRLNIRTGEAYVYDAKTGVTDVKGAILQGLAMGVLAVGSGMAFGYTPYPVGKISPNVINHLHSNVVQDDSLYYFADRERVACLDSSMNTVWSYEFPSKTSAFSQLVHNDSTLYMLNLGYGLRGGHQPMKMGRPFIAAFDKRTGACHYMNMLSLKKDIVEHALLDTDGAFMLFDDGLAYKHELSDSTVTISPWNVSEYGRLWSIVNWPVYALDSQKNVFDVIASDGFHFPVITAKGDIFLVDKELNVSTSYPANSLYWPICMVGDRMCVYSRSSGVQDVWLVSLQGIPEIKLTIPIHGVRIARGKLFLYNNKGLYYLPLE